MTTFQTSAIGALALCAASPIYWLQPSPSQWLMMVCLGGVAILAHYLIAKAYSYADASPLSPLNYSEMMTPVALGWIVFHDFPDRYTFLGAAILIGCAIYISQHERQRTRSEPTGAVDSMLASGTLDKMDSDPDFLYWRGLNPTLTPIFLYE